jgi:hypothetical protein
MTDQRQVSVAKEASLLSDAQRRLAEAESQIAAWHFAFPDHRCLRTVGGDYAIQQVR